ncbi:MAG: hypothetical protein RIS31_46 [Actinomycetota bacterium]|jgi:hypothetical protein
MSDEFGAAYAAVIETDLVLTELQDRTAKQCMEAGEDLREVWLAVCRANNVPQSRWHGLNKITKK